MSTPPKLSDRTKRILPWLVAVAFFMESLDATILNTAVPIMAKALDVVPLAMKSVLSSYTLSLAVFIPISSWMADRFGTRRVFASAIGVFTLGSFLCGISSDIHLLVFCRILQGCGGAMMVPVGRLTLVRSFARSELVRQMSFVAIPALIGPMVGPLAGGLIVGFTHWRMIFFVNLPIGIAGLYLVHRYLPDYHGDQETPLDFVGLALFGGGVALLSYILEVFGETTLSGREVFGLLAISILLLVTYGFHSQMIDYPVLRLGMIRRIRTLRSAVFGNFFTRLGAGGIPFLLPLLYQVGLGYSPIQSGFLIMPQPLAAVCFRLFVPRILQFFGYRRLLLWNTIFIGLTIVGFATIGPGSSIWSIVLQACLFGFFSSLQYTSMNTLAYADVNDADTSMASTIMSTIQQMSLSFGVATASLVTVFFIDDKFKAIPAELVSGLHKGFLVLGGLTIISAFGFMKLKPDDGANVSLHRQVPE
jgi:EmrB/QacA subfamily drug resistance transporter